MDQWYAEFRNSKEYAELKKRPVAYFCAEFALTDTVRAYAGGLGILAGDVIREAADREIPLVAIGLFYREGYLHHDIVKNQVTLQTTPVLDPQDVGLREVMTDKNERLIIRIPVQGRMLCARAWEMTIGSVKVYLLDTNLTENEEIDRKTTDRLYTTDKEIRFKQEMVLGIGGLRLLETLAVHPLVYHLNEGHSALLSMELARHRMIERGKSFLDEVEMTKRQIVFTNHTLIAAGNDVFSTDLVSTLLEKYAVEVGVPVHELIKMGQVRDSNLFSMTLLALRMAGHINAVSKLQSEKAKEIWKDHPMIAVTNGIHLKSWDSMTDTSDLSEQHLENKKQLLKEIQKQTGVTWQENDLLIGWARRMVAYKRPLALFEDLERFKSLAENASKPIRVVFSGHAHQSDTEGAKLLGQLQEMIENELKGSVVYLPDYHMESAKLLVAGCDIWLNTPIVGFEACGTSGMKAALNGTLPLTTKDGWVAEVDLLGKGWILESDGIGKAILDTLENDILPLYYAADGKPDKQWSEMMVSSRKLIKDRFSASVMLQNYLQKMYIPSIAAYHSLPQT